MTSSILSFYSYIILALGFLQQKNVAQLQHFEGQPRISDLRASSRPPSWIFSVQNESRSQGVELRKLDFIFAFLGQHADGVLSNQWRRKLDKSDHDSPT